MDLAVKKIIKPLIWVFCFEFIGYFLGLVTQENIISWYQPLHKSILTPPSIVFPIVWSCLYVILAVAGYLLWENRNKPSLKFPFYLYWLQMSLNWLWTPIFFYYHFIALGLYFILGMILLSLAIIILTRKYQICLFFIPYSVWLIFAAYLNGTILILN